MTPSFEKPWREVLLVEDIEETVVGLTLDLELRGATVHAATTRDSAAEFLTDSAFAAVLVDLNIPESVGGQPSPEHGRGLIYDLVGGAFGDLNQRTPFMLLTAQSIDIRPSEFVAYPSFLGVGSKIGDSRWLFRALISVGVCDASDELDLDFDDVLRERMQVVVTSIVGSEALVDLPDLGLSDIRVPLMRFTEALRRTLASSPMPVFLWAIGNVSASDAEGLQLREFVVSKEQMRIGRDYTRLEWLDDGR